jgi:thioredoxin 1
MEITSQELKHRIDNGEKIIVDFYATWCGPCKIMKPTYDKISEELNSKNSDVKLYTFNIENDNTLISYLGIKSVPTIKSFKGGKEFHTISSMLQENQIRQLVDNLLV